MSVKVTFNILIKNNILILTHPSLKGDRLLIAMPTPGLFMYCRVIALLKLTFHCQVKIMKNTGPDKGQYGNDS